MAEEPDAGGQSPDDEPADADGSGEESPVDGDDNAERDGGSVDSEVEPQGEPADEGEPVDDAESDEPDDGDGHDDGDELEGGVGHGDDRGGDGDDGDVGDDHPAGSDDGSAPADDEARPIGAVTDATAPPSESAPGVDGDDPEDPPASTDDEATGADADGASGSDDIAGPLSDDVYGPHGADPDSEDASSSTDRAGPDAQEPRPDPARDTDDARGYPPEGPPEDSPEGPPEDLPEGRLEHPPEDLPEEPPEDLPVEPPEDLPEEPPGDLPEGRPEGLAEGPPEGPPDDEEMPLADHIEEMILRLAMVCSVAAVAAGGIFFFEPLAEDTIMFIWQSVIPHQDMKVHPLVGGTTHPGHYIEVDSVGSTNPRVYGPLELKLTELKFASLVGFVLALPVFVYETYRFMRPGLYPNERRYYLAAVPTSLVLAFVGISFSYFIILPAIFAYFVRYSERAGELAFALRQTFDLILILMGFMALVFQIPLFIMLAIMMGLTDRQWMEARRLYFWGGFLGVSFLFVPEPTGMAPILVALTMVGLFEGTLALLRWTGN